MESYSASQTISILGCGWYGKALAEVLVKKGIKVKGSVTREEKLPALRELGIEPYIIRMGLGEPICEESDFFNCDVLVIACNVKLSERPGYLDAIARLPAIMIAHQIKKLLFISSTSVYGDHHMIVDEDTIPMPETDSAKILLAAERSIQADPACKVTIIRFGGLVGPGRTPGRFFAGKANIPNGLAPVNLIHLDDCIALTQYLLSAHAGNMIINGVSPDHPSKANFYTAAAKYEGLPLPAFLHENNKWKIVSSKTLPTEKYQYKINDWLKWLDN